MGIGLWGPRQRSQGIRCFERHDVKMSRAFLTLALEVTHCVKLAGFGCLTSPRDSLRARGIGTPLMTFIVLFWNRRSLQTAEARLVQNAASGCVSSSGAETFQCPREFKRWTRPST